MNQRYNQIILKNMTGEFLEYNLRNNLINIILKRGMMSQWTLLYETEEISSSLFFKNIYLNDLVDELRTICVLTKYLKISGQIEVIGIDGIEKNVGFFNINKDYINIELNEEY